MKRLKKIFADNKSSSRAGKSPLSVIYGGNNVSQINHSYWVNSSVTSSTKKLRRKDSNIESNSISQSAIDDIDNWTVEQTKWKISGTGNTDLGSSSVKRRNVNVSGSKLPSLNLNCLKFLSKNEAKQIEIKGNKSKAKLIKLGMSSEVAIADPELDKHYVQESSEARIRNNNSKLLESIVLKRIKSKKIDILEYETNKDLIQSKIKDISSSIKDRFSVLSQLPKNCTQLQIRSLMLEYIRLEKEAKTIKSPSQAREAFLGSYIQKEVIFYDKMKELRMEIDEKDEYINQLTQSKIGFTQQLKKLNQKSADLDDLYVRRRADFKRLIKEELHGSDANKKEMLKHKLEMTLTDFDRKKKNELNFLELEIKDVENQIKGINAVEESIYKHIEELRSIEVLIVHYLREIYIYFISNLKDLMYIFQTNVATAN